MAVFVIFGDANGYSIPVLWLGGGRKEALVISSKHSLDVSALNSIPGVALVVASSGT
jgi:hypothetical protein